MAIQIPHRLVEVVSRVYICEGDGAGRGRVSGGAWRVSASGSRRGRVGWGTGGRVRGGAGCIRARGCVRDCAWWAGGCPSWGVSACASRQRSARPRKHVQESRRNGTPTLVALVVVHAAPAHEQYVP